MALKTTIAAGIAALSMAFMAQGADAKTRVVIGIGTPGWGYGGGYCWNHPNRCRPAPRPVYRYYANPGPVLYYNGPVRAKAKMSCAGARNLVDANGFNEVSARECSGPVYSFTARRAGKLFLVKVDAFRHRIIGTGRI